VNATSGHLGITVARSAAGAQQTADVYAGPFTVTQGSVGQPFTTFRVARPTGCPSTGARSAASGPIATTARRKKRRRRVWVREKGGHWRSSTGSSSASAVGTHWLTTEYCDGTRVTVRQGKVSVRDKVRHRTVLLRAGQSYRTKTR